MKNKLSKRLFKIIPIASLSFLAACSSPEKGNVENVTDASKTPINLDKEVSNENIIEVKDVSKAIENEEVLAPLETDRTKLVDEVIEAKPHSENVNSENVTSENVTSENVEEKIEDLVEEKEIKTISHDIWNELLQKNVSSKGNANYKGFKADNIKLESYLTLLKANVPSNDWSKNEKLAYWINVYNAFTVKLIVDNYPLKSITDLDKPWDKKWIEIDGKTYSLGNVENDILRKMGESRIHFAINCASFSCPNLLNEAFTAEKLSSQLRKVTKGFFNDTTKNQLVEGDLKISKLFEWYAKDFSNGDIIAYLNKYSGKTFSSDAKISFLEYSWNLNE